MSGATSKSPQAAARSLTTLGERLRRERKRQKVTAVAASEAAGLSRVTLHRIERGEASVAIGAWVAVADALGLAFDLIDTKAALKSAPIPKPIRLADYPELKKLGWQLRKGAELTPDEALDLYERNWRHVDVERLTARELALIQALSTQIGGGRLLVRA